MPDFDLVVVGAGIGGYTAAIRGAQLGLNTAIVEKDAIGGLCLNWGCIPSKALLHSAELANLFQRGPEFGIGFDNLRLDIGVAVDRSRDVVQKMVGGVETLLQQNKVMVFRGTARLTSPTSLTVTPGGETLSATNVILATGGVTRSLPNVPIDGDRVLTSREALELKERPSSVVVIGGGAIGVEFAYLWRSFGANVTIVELLDRVLPNEDEDVSRALDRAFRAQGITIKTGTRVEAVNVSDAGATVTVSANGQTEELSADRVLMGVGFGPGPDSLGLKEAGVELDRGYIKIDGYCRTNLPGLWAIGDATGRLALAHVAAAQGLTAVETIAGKTVLELDYVRMPRATYCQPQVASLGLTEAQARERGINVRTGRFPFRGNGKAMAIGETDGFVKLVVDNDTREVIGFHAIGHAVTEMLGEATLGNFLETTPSEIATAVHAHPTLSEIVHEAAMAVDGEAIHFYAPLRG